MDKDELIAALSDGSAESRQASEEGRPTTPRRSIWNGAITFGLITIPVGLCTATEDRDISFHLLSARTSPGSSTSGSRGKTGREVDWDSIVKGYEYEKGKHVIFTPEELDQLAPESARAIDVVQFVDATEIDPIYFEESYCVAPSKVAVKAYALFARALSESDRVGIAKVAIKGEGAAVHPPGT